MTMAESQVFQTSTRDGRGSRVAERLRKINKVPAVVYGHKEATVSITVDRKPLTEAIRHGARVVDLQTERGIEKAQIVEVQWDYLGVDILHVDFKRVSADERIEVEVPVELRGIAPGVAAGGLLDQPLHVLRISCLALSVPDSVRVNINELQLGAAIHIKDLKLPENVQALEDPDAIVVHVKEPHAEPEAPAEAASTAEPEVITRKKAEEEGEETK
jgi:large subunit ribosomal protein L25